MRIPKPSKTMQENILSFTLPLSMCILDLESTEHTISNRPFPEDKMTWMKSTADANKRQAVHCRLMT